jgi:hypothetical protein
MWTVDRLMWLPDEAIDEDDEVFSRRATLEKSGAPTTGSERRE